MQVLNTTMQPAYPVNIYLFDEGGPEIDASNKRLEALQMRDYDRRMKVYEEQLEVINDY